MSTPGRKPKPPTDHAAGHALVGGGPSQLGVDGSLRARDVSRPTEADLEAAEASVRPVRRNPAPPKSAG